MSAASRPSSTSRHKNQISTLQDPPRSLALRYTRSLRERRRLLIVKFGGASLSQPKRINFAVASVALAYGRGNRVLVVVRAVGNTTEHILHPTNPGAELVE